MEKWKTMPLEMPNDGHSCFVRLNYWFGQPFRAYYTSSTKEWTSEENALKYPVWAVCRWEYDTENFYATISPTGLGTGVSTLRMKVSENQTLELTNGNARFYSDAAGTLNESTTWEITTGALQTIYLKSNTGDTGLRFSKPDKVISWGDDSTDGWTSGTDAAKITIDCERLWLENMRITGNSKIIGKIPQGLKYIRWHGATIEWTNEDALPTGLTYLFFNGNKIFWKYTGALPSGLTYTYMQGENIEWTHTGSTPPNTKVLYLNGHKIKWQYDGEFNTGLTFLLLAGNQIVYKRTGNFQTGIKTLYLIGHAIEWTYAGELLQTVIALTLQGDKINWTNNTVNGSENITALFLGNYRVAKMTSAEMLTLIESMTNRTGTLPATVTINDYADYLNPPQTVIDAVALLKSTKSITTVNLGA